MRAILLDQPNFKADIQYDENEYDKNQPGMGIVKRVMSMDKMFRFEVVSPGKNESSPTIILGYPGKEIRTIDPKEKSWSYTTEDELSRAAFTLLVGVDFYYLTKGIMNKASDVRYVSDELYHGHKCMKIRLTNEKLPSPDIGFEAMWFLNGPLYFHVATDQNNLIIGVTGQNQEGKPANIIVLKNISLNPEEIPKALFEIPPGFRERK